MNQIAITGASGLIGTALSNFLVARGDKVVRFVRPDSPSASGSVIEWDPARGFINREQLRSLGSLDGVVHLAGAGIADQRWTAARKNEIVQSRVQSTRLLAQALVETGAQVPFVVSGSAIGIYGSRGDEILTEVSPEGSGFLAEVCHDWEHAAAPLISSGSGVALLRTGIVLARSGGALKKQLPLFQAGLGGRLSSGEQWMSPVLLNDLVRSIVYILEHHIHGPVNAVGPVPITNAQFTQALAKVLHRPAVASVPRFALKAALGGELVDEAILASQRVIPAVLTGAGFEFEAPTVENAFTSIFN